MCRTRSYCLLILCYSLFVFLFFLCWATCRCWITFVSVCASLCLFKTFNSILGRRCNIFCVKKFFFLSKHGDLWRYDFSNVEIIDMVFLNADVSETIHPWVRNMKVKNQVLRKWDWEKVFFCKVLVSVKIGLSSSFCGYKFFISQVNSWRWLIDFLGWDFMNTLSIPQ